MKTINLTPEIAALKTKLKPPKGKIKGVLSIFRRGKLKDHHLSNMDWSILEGEFFNVSFATKEDNKPLRYFISPQDQGDVLYYVVFFKGNSKGWTLDESSISLGYINRDYDTLLFSKMKGYIFKEVRITYLNGDYLDVNTLDFKSFGVEKMMVSVSSDGLTVFAYPYGVSSEIDCFVFPLKGNNDKWNFEVVKLSVSDVAKSRNAKEKVNTKPLYVAVNLNPLLLIALIGCNFIALLLFYFGVISFVVLSILNVSMYLWLLSHLRYRL